MKRFGQVVFAMFIGAVLGCVNFVHTTEKPVGYVTSDHCVRQACTTYEFNNKG